MKKGFIYLLSAALVVSGVQQPVGAVEENITVSMYTPSNTGEDLSEFLEIYYPNVTLEVSVFPEEQYYTILKTSLALGNGPDLMNVQPGYGGSNGVEELAPAGYLFPLYEEEKISDFSKDFILSQGQVYGESAGRMALGMVYRRDILEAAGLSLPTCWEEFLDCCEALSEQGIPALIMGGKDLSSYQYALYQIAANQLYPEREDYDRRLREHQAAFSDPGTWDEILERFVSLFDAGYFYSDSLSLTSIEANERYEEGAAAFYIGTSLGYYSFLNTAGNPEQYGFIPFPANSEGIPLCISSAPVGNHVIYAGSAHAELLRKIMTEYYEYRNSEINDPISVYTEGSYEEAPVYYFCNQGWPGEVEIVLENRLAEYLTTGLGSVQEICRAMQAELEKSINVEKFEESDE